MAANGSAVIGFDTMNYRIVIMTAVASTPQKATVDYVPFNEDLNEGADYVSALENALKSYKGLANLQQYDIYLVLPDNLVGVDYVVLPIMKKARMADALRIEFEGFYKNYADLAWNSAVVLSNKRNAMYQLTVTDKATLNAMQKIITGGTNKMSLKTTSFAANCACNAVMQLRPKTRHKNFIFVDIKEDITRLVVCGKDRLFGYQYLPFGYNILSRDEVNTEALLFDHDMAELAVINAGELAKAKQLTIAESNINDVPEIGGDEDGEDAPAKAKPKSDDSDEEEAAPVANAAMENKEAEPAVATVPAESEPAAQDAGLEGSGIGAGLEGSGIEGEGQAAGEEGGMSYQSRFQTGDEIKKAATVIAEEPDEFEEEVEQLQTPARVKKAKVFVKKTPKRLPMFMQRPIPETEEGFILENFRILEKRMLLCKKHCDLEEFIPTPEFIVINMPEEYAFVVDELNKDSDSGIEFRYYEPQEENNPELAANIELFGALFTAAYNKDHNFDIVK